MFLFVFQPLADYPYLRLVEGESSAPQQELLLLTDPHFVSCLLLFSVNLSPSCLPGLYSRLVDCMSEAVNSDAVVTNRLAEMALTSFRVNCFEHLLILYSATGAKSDRLIINNHACNAKNVLNL